MVETAVLGLYTLSLKKKMFLIPCCFKSVLTLNAARVSHHIHLKCVAFTFVVCLCE